jgi:dUTP pyrophosphatase
LKSSKRSAPIAWFLFSSLSSSTNNNNNNINNNMTECLRVKRLSDQATLPTRGSPLSAGLDLSSAEAKVIPPGGRAVVKTDLSIACPPGTYARVAPRSGLAVKHGIDVGAGVVDADYRGPLGVVLFNLGQEDFTIQVGDRIAQLILEEIKMVPVVDVGEGDLDATERGAGGFGSTGVN